MKLYSCKGVNKCVSLFHLLQINNGRSIYLITNICISLLGFVRSFVYMNGIKDLSNLGYLSILQTVIMFIGLFQLGLINYSSNSNNVYRSVSIRIDKWRF